MFFVVLGMLGVLVLAHISPASAAPRKLGKGPWLRIDRVEAQPSLIQGYARLRLFVTTVNLQGVILDITGPKAWTLTLGKQKKRIPYIAGAFQSVGDELAVALIVQKSPEFKDALPAIAKSAGKLIEALPRETRVTLITYANDVQGSRRLGSPTRVIKGLPRIAASFEPGDPALLKAMDRARRGLAKVKPSEPGKAIRKVIIVIGDGKDTHPEPKVYRKAAKRADREGIRIHSIAFAPDGNRLPLRGLAEMSKRTLGTFRWVRTKSSFDAHFDQLLKELQKQYVLTFFVPQDEVVGKRVGLLVADKDLEAVESVRVAKLTCGKDPCGEGQYCVDRTCVSRNRDAGRGILGWILLVGGILLGLLVLFVIVSLLLGWLTKRAQGRQDAEAMAGVYPTGEHTGLPPGQSPEAGEAGPRRIMPQGPHGQPVQPTAPRGSQHHVAQPRPASAQHQVVQAITPPTGAHGAVAPQQAMMAGGAGPSLYIVKGPYQGQQLPLCHGFTIGNAPGCHLQLVGDNFASGHHAQILMDTRGGCMLVDKGSTNGTFINGVRTTQKRLSHGMLIKIGMTEARFMAQ